MKRHRIDGYTLAIVDLLTALTIVFAAMAVLAIIAAEKQAHPGVHPGTLAIEMTWQMSANADVDLWVKAPGDKAVGYAHRNDAHCNLLRDDLGRALDPESRNEEMTICRGVDPGEWIVDVMLYRTYDDVLPVKVTVTVKQVKGTVTEILHRTIELQSPSEQETMFRFSLDQKGHYIHGSENFLPMPLFVIGNPNPMGQSAVSPTGHE